MGFSPALIGRAGPSWQLRSDGWTDFYPSSDSRVIYVADPANGGSLSNDGFQPTSDGSGHGPKATLPQAYALVRNGFADHVYLNRGDTFVNGWGGTGNGFWGRIGRSRYQPHVVKDYGNTALDRPKIIPFNLTIKENLWTSTGTAGQNLAIQNVEFYNPYWDPSSLSYGVKTFRGNISAGNTITNIASTADLVIGMTASGPGVDQLTIQSIDSATQVTLSGSSTVTATDVMFAASFLPTTLFDVNGWTSFLYVEGCLFNFVEFAVESVPGFSSTSGNLLYQVGKDYELRFRRNTVWKSAAPFSRIQGVFIGDTPTATQTTYVQENFLYENGRRFDLMASDTQLSFNHNAYCHDAHPAHEFVGNITARAPTNGYMQRNGSLAKNNLYIECGYPGTMGTGIQPNPLEISYNTILECGDTEACNVIAASDSAAGSTTITVDGIRSSPAGSSSLPTNTVLYNIDNPGSLGTYTNTRVVGSVSNHKVITLGSSKTVAAGTRGDGVKAGDRIGVIATGGIGQYEMGASNAWHFAGPPGSASGGTYPIGSSTFSVPVDKPIPSWVQVGYGVVGYQGRLANTARITAISGDRLTFSTDTTNAGVITYGAGRPVAIAENIFGPKDNMIFFDPIGSSASQYPSSSFGPYNIFANHGSKVAHNKAITLSPICCFTVCASNVFYNWASNTTLNIEDVGIQNMVGTQFINENSNNYPNATLEAYTLTIGGDGTKAWFYNKARGQHRYNWDVRYTAPAFNTYMRSQFGVPEPT